MRFAPPIVTVAAALVAALAMPGCIGKPWNPAATQPATEVDPATTQPSYWLSLPAVVEVGNPSFTTLWDACEQAIRDSLFQVDRKEYRSGLLTSQPMVSKQFFEFWRGDAPSGGELTESSIAPIRRTIYFQLRRNEDNTFTATPRVLVERYAKVEQKLRGSIEFEPQYWYPIRRDVAMEKSLGRRVQQLLKRPATTQYTS